MVIPPSGRRAPFAAPALSSARARRLARFRPARYSKYRRVLGRNMRYYESDPRNLGPETRNMMSNTIRQTDMPMSPVALAGALCYALGPAGALYFLKFSPHRHIWPVRLHACHSLLMTGLFLAGWLFLTAAEAVLPWFTSVVVREIRVCAMLGAVPVWLLAAISAFRGYRFVAIPILHEMAVKLARHVEHNHAHA